MSGPLQRPLPEVGRLVSRKLRHTLGSQWLPGQMETAVFHVVQEALTNLVRHAGVKEAAVRRRPDSAGHRG